MDIKDINTLTNKTSVSIHGMAMPVLIDGHGSMPCLCVGIGSLMQKTLSANFKKHFTVYSTDLYWVNQTHEVDVSSIDIERICRDIISVAEQLNLKRYYLLGHSVFGGIVTEAAKYQPKELAGVIGVAATPGWDEKIIQFKNDYFDQHASARRKQRFSELQAEYNRIRKDSDSLVSVQAYYAESPKYFAQDVTLNDIAELWRDIDCNDAVINHLFNTLLPNHDFSPNVEKITAPVIIAGGNKDYDSVPLEIWRHYPEPQHFTLLDCGNAGHWPHMEAAQVFDAGVIGWVRS